MDNEHVICKPTLPALLTCFTSQGFFPLIQLFGFTHLSSLFLKISHQFLFNFFTIKNTMSIYIYIYIHRKNKLKKKSSNKIY